MRIGRLSRLWPSQRRRDADECLRCHTSFVFSRAHPTRAESPHLPTIFVIGAVCETCWQDLTPAERIPYYQRRWIEKRGPNPQENGLIWQAIEYAVLAGA